MGASARTVQCHPLKFASPRLLLTGQDGRHLLSTIGSGLEPGPGKPSRTLLPGKGSRESRPPARPLSSQLRQLAFNDAKARITSRRWRLPLSEQLPFLFCFLAFQPERLLASCHDSIRQSIMNSSDPAQTAGTGDNRGGSLIGAAVATVAISATFVGLRFYTRGVLIKTLGWPDWVILISLVSWEHDHYTRPAILAEFND